MTMFYFKGGYNILFNYDSNHSEYFYKDFYFIIKCLCYVSYIQKIKNMHDLDKIIPFMRASNRYYLCPIAASHEYIRFSDNKP